MKRKLFFGFIAASALLFSNCGSSKKTTSAPKTTFANDITTIVQSKCAPCHIPDKGGNKKAYDVYDNVKTDIDNIIRRIELNPGERGFMPFRNEKLDAATIAVFKKWKEDGMPQ
ncbi:MAG: hypothetical protein NVV59_04340 [Chitinophagaceae bacterium]|nr:hypothetical protein [Chitinophagaceae bacterium]